MEELLQSTIFEVTCKVWSILDFRVMTLIGHSTTIKHVHFNNEGVMLISLVVAISIPAFGARKM